MRKNNYIRRRRPDFIGHVPNNSKACKSRVAAVVFIAVLLVIALVLPALSGISAHAEDKSADQLNENISKLLNDLDLSELQKYFDENGVPGGFGDTAKDVLEYLIRGNLGTDYGGYLNELFGIIFKDVINMIPAFAAVVGIALLCAVIASAEGSVIGKSTSKIVKLACYSFIILILATLLTGIVSECIGCINSIKRQIEIITPILATLTVLTGGAGSSAIYQPSAIFLSGGAVEIIGGFIVPATIAVITLDLLSKLNPQMSFTGVSALLKSIMKWVIGITVTVFSIFITAQSSAASLFDGIIFKATKYVVGNSVPLVGNFLSNGFDMLTSAGLLIKSSVGLCGILLLLAEISGPVVLLAAFSIILKFAGAVAQPVGENDLYGMLSDLSKDIEYLIAGLLTVAFMYALVVMLIVNSANSFI